MAYLWFVLGLAGLVVGAEVMVRGASQLAHRFGISPLVVGLTVVAFGTSAPELAVSVGAALGETPEVALGNVVGSNVFNVFLILGLSALVTPLAISTRLVRIDVPILVGVTMLLLWFCADGVVGRGEGALLVALGAAYTLLQIREGRHEPTPDDLDAADPPTRGGRQLLLDLALIGLGLTLLIVGSRWLLSGATTIARGLGVSELVISLSLVAAGTSLPEVATSVLASIRGQRDIAVGNVVGSNLFNILGVLGVSSLVSRAGVPVAPQLWTFDLPVAAIAALACLPIFWTGRVIARWEGGLFLGYYIVYCVGLFGAATGVFGAPELRWLTAAFVVPLLVVSAGIVLQVRADRRG